MLYWVSALVQEERTVIKEVITKVNKTVLLQMNTAESNLNEAKNVIANIRKYYPTFSAWIDIYDENNNKATVFHECYCDMFGNIQKP